MIDIDKIIKMQNHQFLSYEEKHKRHNRRVKQTLKWLNEILVNKHQNTIISSIFMYQDVRCLCTRVDIRSAPHFTCNFDFKPLNADDDIGNGKGCIRPFDFGKYF